jgi:hypothetical protein
VRIRINGRETLALVDTGASLSMMDAWGADRVGLEPLGPPALTVPARTPGGSTEQMIAVARTIELGALRVEAVPMGILWGGRSQDLALEVEGYRVEAILGCDLLSRLAAVTFDFRAEAVEFSARTPPRRTLADGTGVLPMSLRSGLPVMQGEIRGRGALAVALDSGGDFGLWIPRSLGNELHFAFADSDRIVRSALTVGGPNLYRNLAPQTLGIGGMTLRELPTRLSLYTVPPGDPPYALLGTRALRDRRVTVDFAGGRILIEKP